MLLHLAHKSTLPEKIRKKHPDAEIIDVTSRGPEPWVRFSPFFPHGGIPVPFTAGRFSQSVEGVWQGLKVFEQQDVDASRFEVTDMKGLKRSARKYGRVLGHRRGVHGEALMAYGEARRGIYLPTYRWVLEQRLRREIELLAALAAGKAVVLLDYETNADVNNLDKPLSHAALVKAYLEGNWPAEG